MEVVRIAKMVPIGMERWASLRSPERLEPAMIPEEQDKIISNITPTWFAQKQILQTHNTRNIYLCSILKSHYTAGLAIHTCDRWEEDAHQQGKGGGDISKHIWMMSRCRV